MSLVRPKVVVAIDGEPLSNGRVKNVTVSHPDGDQGGTCSIQFAKEFETQAFPVITTTTHLVVRMGYEGRAGCPVIFDSAKLSSSSYRIDGSVRLGAADSFSATWRSKLNDRQTLAPSVLREVYTSDKKGLHGLMRWVARKLGYGQLRTNLPNVTLPRETVFTPERGYYKTLASFLSPFSPIIFADDIADTLYVYWLDAAIPGSPASLRFRKLHNRDINKDTRRIVNQVLLRYYPQGRDGISGDDCGHPSNVTSDDLPFTSLQVCGGDVDLGAREPGELESIRESVNEARGQDGERIITRTSYFVFSDGREVKFRTKTTTYAKPPGGGIPQKVAETTTDYLYLAGTNYEQPSGERTQTDGVVALPGVGRKYRPKVRTSVTQCVSGQFKSDPGVWHDLWRETLEKGYLLWPDRVALDVADVNDAVDTSPSTYQEARPNRKLRRRIETTTQLGARHLGYAWIEVDYTKDPPRRSSDRSEQTLGRQPKKDDAIDPIEELIQSSDMSDGAREAEVIDTTWVGSDTESIDGAGPDTLTGRALGLELTAATFRRSGKRVATDVSNSAKALTRLARGSVVIGTRRNEENPHVYVITGTVFQANAVKEQGRAGAFKVSSQLTGRRLESGETD